MSEVKRNKNQGVFLREGTNGRNRDVLISTKDGKRRSPYGQFQTVKGALSRKGAIRSVTYWLINEYGIDSTVVNGLWAIAETIPTGDGQPKTLKAKANSDAFEAIVDYIGKVGGELTTEIFDGYNLFLNSRYTAQFIGLNVMQACAIGNTALTDELSLDVRNTVGRVIEKRTS